jgi:hypothetical protein
MLQLEGHGGHFDGFNMKTRQEIIITIEGDQLISINKTRSARSFKDCQQLQ